MENIRSTKCKYCKKYLGESFKDYPEGIVDDGENLYCNSEHYKKGNVKNPLDEIFVESHKPTKLKEGINFKDEIRLLRDYTQRKLKELESSLNNLIQFARDDLKRIDELNEKADKCLNLAKETEGEDE